MRPYSSVFEIALAVVVAHGVAAMGQSEPACNNVLWNRL